MLQLLQVALDPFEMPPHREASVIGIAGGDGGYNYAVLFQRFMGSSRRSRDHAPGTFRP